jgi:hypothetical protein
VTTRAILLGALLLGVCCALIPPNISRDFWYYLAIGRDASAGVNVYTTRLSDAAVAGLPLESGLYRSMTAPYGPVWVWLSAGLSSIVGSSRLGYVGYKLLMFAAWAITLWLVYRALEDSERHQRRAVIVLGIVPLLPVETLINGHNDIVMVALLTPWLVRPDQSWWLAASVLVKFVTAPLFVVAGIDALARRSTRAVAGVVLSTVAASLIILWYWQDGALLAQARVSRSWELFTPAAVLSWGAQAEFWPFWVSATIIATWRLALIAAVVWYGWQHWQTCTRESLNAWATVTIGAILLGSNYILPWYLVWIVPSLLLAKNERLIWIAWPFLILMPLFDLLRTFGFSGRRLTVALYVAAAGWLCIGWFRLPSGGASHQPRDPTPA